MNTKSGQIMTNPASGVFQEMDKDVKKKKKFLGMGFWKISNSFLTFKVAAKLPIFSVIAELLFSKTTAELGEKEWK